MVGMLDLEGYTHEWITGRAVHDLLMTLDDADGRILYAELVAQEGTLSTFQALGCCTAPVRPVLRTVHRPWFALLPHRRSR